MNLTKLLVDTELVLLELAFMVFLHIFNREHSEDEFVGE